MRERNLSTISSGLVALKNSGSINISPPKDMTEAPLKKGKRSILLDHGVKLIYVFFDGIFEIFSWEVLRVDSLQFHDSTRCHICGFDDMELNHITFIDLSVLSRDTNLNSPLS